MGSNSPRTTKIELLLVEVKRATDVDSGVTLAALEYILSHNLLRQSRHQTCKPTVCIMTTDHPPKALQPLCKRCSIPMDNTIDAYTHWYEPPPTMKSTPGRTFIHIADASRTKEGLLSHIASTITETLKMHPVLTGQEFVVVLNSLTSVLRFADGLNSFIAFRNTLAETLSQHPSSPSTVTLLATVQTVGTGHRLTNALIKLAETHVHLLQPRDKSKLHQFRDTVHMRVRRRKPSGRVHFELVSGTMQWHTQQLVNVETQRGAGVWEAASQKSITAGAAEAEGEDERALRLAERGLSFRISLSSKEREMRAAAGLPYLHQDETLADSALELHPKSLQVGLGHQHSSEEDRDSDVGDENDDDDDDDDDSDFSDDELFSEDV